MSSVVAYEPYVVRTGRGDPFAQAAIYKHKITYGVSFGPDFVMTFSRATGVVGFVQ